MAWVEKCLNCRESVKDPVLLAPIDMSSDDRGRLMMVHSAPVWWKLSLHSGVERCLHACW